MNMQTLFVIEEGVELGLNWRIDPFVYLGKKPQNWEHASPRLQIGQDAIIRSHTVIYAGTRIGDRFQTGHNVLIREDSIIGDDCSIGSGSILEFRVRIAHRVRLHSQVFIPEYCEIEDDVWIGPRAVLTNAKYPASPFTKKCLQGVIIKKGAIIGANATILPGLIVGEHALVGAGAVVTRPVASREIVIGNPARSAGMVDKLRFSDINQLAYPESLSGNMSR